MNKVQMTAKWKKRIEESDIPMLVLALVGVVLYMLDLLNIWESLGMEHAYLRVSQAIDLAFLLDLLVKLAVLRGPYLKSPWFVVDIISVLPVLGLLISPSNTLVGLRFIRGIRFFRALRVLRMLRVIPILKFKVNDQTRTPETDKFRLAMWICLPIYTLVFIGLIDLNFVLYGEQARLFEFYMILGSLLSLLLVILLVRYLLPALMSVQIHGLLNIALPSQVADYFLKHPDSYSHTVRMPATILFSDIKGFTSAVEQIGVHLDVLKQHLELVMDAVTEVHRKYDLIIDKFIGDAIMSFRGGDLVEGDAEDHAWRVVRAAIEGRKALQALNDPYFRDVKIAGASSDAVLIGAFGTSTRLSYTVLGDSVNVAARLESAVKQCGTQNLFCESTYALLKERKDLVWRRFGRITVEGRMGSLDIYEVFDVNDFADPTWISLYHEALEEFEDKNFVVAKRLFVRANDLRLDGDFPSRRYVELCQKLIENPPPSDWKAVFVTYK